MAIKRFNSGDILAFPINKKEYGFLYYILGNSIDYRLVKVFNYKVNNLNNIKCDEIINKQDLYKCTYLFSTVEKDKLIKIGNIPFDFSKHSGLKIYLSTSINRSNILDSYGIKYQDKYFNILGKEYQNNRRFGISDWELIEFEIPNKKQNELIYKTDKKVGKLNSDVENSYPFGFIIDEEDFIEKLNGKIDKLTILTEMFI